jgi:hypothetical protein
MSFSGGARGIQMEEVDKAVRLLVTTKFQQGAAQLSIERVVERRPGCEPEGRSKNRKKPVGEASRLADAPASDIDSENALLHLEVSEHPPLSTWQVDDRGVAYPHGLSHRGPATRAQAAEE